MLLYATDNSRSCTETFDTLDTWVVWSLIELQHGQFMTVDPWQNPINRPQGPIAGPYRAVLVNLKGDEKFIQKVLKLKTSWVSQNVCSVCRAAKSDALIYTSFGKHAPHRGTCLDTRQFIEEACRPGPWPRLPGFHISLVTFDWLHIVDLAIIPECSASVTWHMEVKVGCPKVFANFAHKQKVWGLTLSPTHDLGVGGVDRDQPRLVWPYCRRKASTSFCPISAGLQSSWCELLSSIELVIGCFVFIDVCFWHCLLRSGNRGQMFSLSLGCMRFVSTYCACFFFWLCSKEAVVSVGKEQFSNIGSKTLQRGRCFFAMLFACLWQSVTKIRTSKEMACYPQNWGSCCDGSMVERCLPVCGSVAIKQRSWQAPGFHQCIWLDRFAADFPFPKWYCQFQSWLRLRAAVFVNLVAMREAISNKINNGPVLRDENLQVLQRATFLWHSAHNCFMFASQMRLC